MVRSVAGQQEAYDNLFEWLLESEAQEAYEEYVERKQREYLTESKKILVGGKAYKVLKTVSSYETTPLKPEVPEIVGMNNFNEWIKKVLSQDYVDTPIARVSINAKDLENHIDGKVRRERNWRKTTFGYPLMTLSKPQEIWVNKRKGGLSFVYVRYFGTIAKGEIIRLVQIVVVDGKTGTIKTYYSEKGNPESLYKKRRGWLIYERRKGKEFQLPAPSIT